MGSLEVPLIHPVEWVAQQHKAPNGADILDTRTNAANLERPPPSWAHSNTGDMEVNLNVEHPRGPPFSNNQRITIQLPTLKNGPQDHSIRRSFDGSNWGGGPIRRQQRNTGVSGRGGNPTGSTMEFNPRLVGGGPHRSYTHGTNSTWRKMRTWKIRPTTDCKGGTEARKRRKTGQGMSHGMPGGNMGLQCCSHASSLPCRPHNSQDQLMLRLRANRNPDWTEGQTLAGDPCRNRGTKLLHHE